MQCLLWYHNLQQCMPFVLYLENKTQLIEWHELKTFYSGLGLMTKGRSFKTLEGECGVGGGGVSHEGYYIIVGEWVGYLETTSRVRGLHTGEQSSRLWIIGRSAVGGWTKRIQPYILGRPWRILCVLRIGKWTVSFTYVEGGLTRVNGREWKEGFLSRFVLCL